LKNVKKFVYISFLTCSITIPTTTFATDDHSPKGQNGFQTVFNQMLSFFQVNMYDGENFNKIEHVTAATNNSTIYIDDNKFDAKRIEQYLKNSYKDKDYDRDIYQDSHKDRYHYHDKNCDFDHGSPKDDFDSMGIWRDWYGSWGWDWEWWGWWKKP
jgi:hypothetical protein